MTATLRELAKEAAPPGVTTLVRRRRDVWGDARLRLLGDVGHVPSHAFRRFWYRRAGMTFPASSSIHFRASFYSPENIVIGEGVTIGFNAFLDGRSGLTIGDHVNLGGNVQVYTREHDIDSPDFAETGAPVVIGRHAYLGSSVIVLPGVTIGEGGVVGAGSVVTRDVAPFTFVAGVPARHVRDRSTDLRYTLGYAKRFV